MVITAPPALSLLLTMEMKMISTIIGMILINNNGDYDGSDNNNTDTDIDDKNKDE